MENYSDSYQNGGGRRDTDFQKLAQNIGTNIQKILQNVSSMSRMINQIGSSQDNQQLQNQLHQIQHYTGQLAKDTSKDLHSLSDGVSTLSQSEQRQWRLQKERLHNDFTKALNSFQAAQRTAAQKEKEAIKAAKKNQEWVVLQVQEAKETLLKLKKVKVRKNNKNVSKC